ncbi:MAG: isocitrate lyase/phosphoenolpyruvate mutase family protein [Thermoanaerobaculia bacterium]
MPPTTGPRGSARILEQAGFAAIATTSAGIAFSRGAADGTMDEPEGLDCIARIVSAVACPVSADQVAATVAAAAAGAPGAGAAMSPVVHRQNRGGGSSQKIS